MRKKRGCKIVGPSLVFEYCRVNVKPICRAVVLIVCVTFNNSIVECNSSGSYMLIFYLTIYPFRTSEI